MCVFLLNLLTSFAISGAKFTKRPFQINLVYRLTKISGEFEAHVFGSKISTVLLKVRCKAVPTQSSTIESFNCY